MINKYKDRVFTNNKNLEFKIIYYKDTNNVIVEFIKTGYVKSTTMRSINNGTLKDKLSPTVCGVGVLGYKYKVTFDCNEYNKHEVWRGFIRRCYDEKHQINNPSYIGCNVSDNFKNYSYFYEWCDKQVGFNQKDDDGEYFHIDKDLLVKGNKTYSEETCVFIPKAINLALVKSVTSRGKFPMGVLWKENKKRFVARIAMGNKPVDIGYFKSSTEAFNAYKQAKENYLKQLAEKWKGQIDERAYNALMNYQVEITD